MNKKKIIATVVMIVALIIILVITLNKEEEQQPASGFETHRIVAHAMGELTATRIPMLGRPLSLTMNGELAYLKLIFCYRRMISWLLGMNGQVI